MGWCLALCRRDKAIETCDMYSFDLYLLTEGAHGGVCGVQGPMLLELNAQLCQFKPLGQTNYLT